MTAPERIWAWHQKDGLLDARRWSIEPNDGDTEYVRADLCATPPDVAELVEALRAMAGRMELYGGQGGIYLGHHDAENLDRARKALAKWEGR